MGGLDDAELLSLYRNDLVMQDMSPKTIENYLSATHIFVKFLGQNNMHLVSVTHDTKDILEEFIRYLREDRMVGYERMKVYFSALNNLYDFLIYKGFVRENVVLMVRRRYLRRFKNGYVPAQRKIIEVEEMAGFLDSIIDVRAKAICMVFVKTGVRRGELIGMDVDDIDFVKRSILLKKGFHKRSNRKVFFDEECERSIEKWLKRRVLLAKDEEPALFVSDFGNRLQRRGVYDSVVKWAQIAGISDFSPHNLRHCFTTYLRRAGMPREYIQELRGDQRRETIDIYDHIDEEELRRSYLACMPQLGMGWGV